MYLLIFYQRLDNPHTLKWLSFRVFITKMIKLNLLFIKENILQPILAIEPNRLLMIGLHTYNEFILDAFDVAEENGDQGNVPVETIVFSKYYPSEEHLTFYMESCVYTYFGPTTTQSHYFSIFKFLGGRTNPFFDSLKNILLAKDMNQLLQLVFSTNENKNVNTTEHKEKILCCEKSSIPKTVFSNQLRLNITDTKYIIGNTKKNWIRNCNSRYINMELWELFKFDTNGNDESGLNLCQNGYADSMSYYEDFVHSHQQKYSHSSNYEFCYGHPLLYMPENIHCMYSLDDIKKLRLQFVLYDDRGVPSNRIQLRIFLQNCQIYKSYLYLKQIVPHTTFINYAREEQKCKLS